MARDSQQIANVAIKFLIFFCRVINPMGKSDEKISIAGLVCFSYLPLVCTT
jgi:hypothetical protein